MAPNSFHGDIRFYKHISIVLFSALALNSIALLLLNVDDLGTILVDLFKSERKAFVIQLFFWASLGATVSSYKFFARDKELNEVESLKEEPDPLKLRYPDGFDVVLYVQRIVFSGMLGIVGGILLFAGLGYFDVPEDSWGSKQEMFFVVFCFLIGMHQNDFLAFLSDVNDRLLRRKPTRSAEHPGSNLEKDPES